MVPDPNNRAVAAAQSVIGDGALQHTVAAVAGIELEDLVTARESLTAAGYHDIKRCAFGVTCSRFPQLASLDNRERETLFVEANK